MRSSHGSTCPYPEAHFTGAYSSPSAPHLTPFITHSYALLVSWPENIVRRALEVEGTREASRTILFGRPQCRGRILGSLLGVGQRKPDVAAHKGRGRRRRDERKAGTKLDEKQQQKSRQEAWGTPGTRLPTADPPLPAF